MSKALTDEETETEWARFESWLRKDKWTSDEAAALLAGIYPDQTRFVEFVPNGRPRAWQGKDASEVSALTSQLRQSLHGQLKRMVPENEFKAMAPSRWLELALEAPRTPPQWLLPALVNPRLARHMPPSIAERLQSKLASRTKNGVVRGGQTVSRLNGEIRTKKLGDTARAQPLDLGSIQEWAYIPTDFVEAILAESKSPLAVPEEDRDLLHVVMRDITLQLLEESFGRRPTSVEVARVRETFESFAAAVEALRELDYPPPFPLQEWKARLLQWLEWEEKALDLRRKGGRPINEWDRHAYPRLLGFYQLAFGRRAASTKGGPAFRFIQRYLDAVYNSLAVASFTSAIEREQVLGVWRVPNPPGLESKKIRAARANGEAKMLFCQHKPRATKLVLQKTS